MTTTTAHTTAFDTVPFDGVQLSFTACDVNRVTAIQSYFQLLTRSHIEPDQTEVVFEADNGQSVVVNPHTINALQLAVAQAFFSRNRGAQQ